MIESDSCEKSDAVRSPMKTSGIRELAASGASEDGWFGIQMGPYYSSQLSLLFDLSCWEL